jgi:SAM-dependent methyltransferase
LEEPQFSHLLTGKRMLHFAPEPVLSDVFRRKAGAYVTANINGSAQLRLDITSMPEVGDSSYDAVVACDVLEHVRDDRVALLEIHRVLLPGGFVILTVPQKDGLAETYEDSSITEPSDRERHFGQWDHLRIYGDSFPRIVEACGFRVTTIDAASFAQAVVKRQVLFPPVLSPHPLATNHRRIFFGQKIA